MFSWAHSTDQHTTILVFWSVERVHERLQMPKSTMGASASPVPSSSTSVGRVGRTHWGLLLSDKLCFRKQCWPTYGWELVFVGVVTSPKRVCTLFGF